VIRKAASVVQAKRSKEEEASEKRNAVSLGGNSLRLSSAGNFETPSLLSTLARDDDLVHEISKLREKMACKNTRKTLGQVLKEIGTIFSWFDRSSGEAENLVERERKELHRCEIACCHLCEICLISACFIDRRNVLRNELTSKSRELELPWTGLEISLTNTPDADGLLGWKHDMVRHEDLKLLRMFPNEFVVVVTRNAIVWTFYLREMASQGLLGRRACFATYRGLSLQAFQSVQIQIGCFNSK